MSKKIDPHLIEILTKYEERPEDALWDCHGTWVAYHSAVERIAAKAGITFDMPTVVEASAASKIVSIVVRGAMGDKSEWSFGEAAPANNKNGYPYAMAEKRAKDRVTLKLIGLHGLVYSEEEADGFKAPSPTDTTTKPKREPGFNANGNRSARSLKQEGVWQEFERELLECSTGNMLTKLALAWSAKAEADKWPQAWKDAAREEINKRRLLLQNQVEDADDFPGDRPLRPGDNAAADSLMGG